MAQDRFHTTHNYLVTSPDLPGVKFSSLTGGAVTVEGVKVWPGGSESPRNVDGQASVEDITIGKPHDPVADVVVKAWVAGWKNGTARRKITIVKQLVNAAGLPDPSPGSTETYRNCSFRNYTPPSLERGTANAAMIMLTLSPESYEV